MTKIAWATASLSNGYIYQWSRWHTVYNLAQGTVTLCGMPVPHTKWVTGGNDNRIQGGKCTACTKADKDRYPKPQ